MGRYLPYAETHSIQEAVVAVHFSRSVDDPGSVERAFDLARSELQEDFGKSNPVHRLPPIEITPGAQGLVMQQPDVSPSIAGFELTKIQSNGNPAYVLRLLNDTLSVHFVIYENWEDTRRKSLNYIQFILKSLNLASNPVVSLSLRYIDRYTFDGPANEPAAELLLRKESKYIAKSCFGVGSLWHCHSGWFETIFGENRALNQLNVGSMEIDRSSSIVIDHNAICHLHMHRQTFDSLFSDTGSQVGAEKIWETMHGKNKSVLKDMLRPEASERIGIIL